VNFQVVTLFPEMIEQASDFGVVGGALKQGILSLSAVSPRQFTNNVHQTVDDRPFGGGDGMIMLAEPLALCLEQIIAANPDSKPYVIHMSPRGIAFNDRKARELAKSTRPLVIVASRYGGVDQRVLNRYVDEEISIGDYVLSGGELAALVIVDAVARHLPGVLGNETSAVDESFAPSFEVLEHPQYTRPRAWRGEEVPQALLSGHHSQIAEWKRALSILVTCDRRVDLLGAVDPIDLRSALKVLNSLSDSDMKSCGLSDRETLNRALNRTLQDRGGRSGNS